MNITSAVFRCSSQKLSQCPADNRWEFAFIGRSNVGKSSLINMLTDSPALAKVSATPGKTRLINHFLINGSWYLVDLPGYGYARVSKGQRKEFSKLILDYILKREQMYFLFVLVDSRLEPQKIDLDFMSLLGEHGIPFGIVFTKCDKLSANQTESNIARYRRTLLESWEELPPIFRTSSEKRQGREGADPRFYRDMPRRCAGTSGPTRKRRT
jgi:GTP-binding protein